MNAIPVDKDQKYNGPRETYRVSGNVVAAAGLFPFLKLMGAAGKVIRIQKITFSGITLTAVAYLRIVINKLSADNSGGTSSSPTKVPLDSNSPASGATVAQYTAAPTAGTLIGQVAEKTVLGQATTPAAGGFPADQVFDFSDKSGNTPIVLRGVAEGITACFGAAPATAVTLSYEIEYTEDGN